MFGETVFRLSRQNIGFDPSNLLVASVQRIGDADVSTLFGASALLLSAIGIYGIVARSVTDRLLPGIPAALIASRAIGAMLFGVSPAAPHTFVMVTAVITTAAALGTLAPVHRAGRVDPAIALRKG